MQVAFSVILVRVKRVAIQVVCCIFANLNQIFNMVNACQTMPYRAMNIGAYVSSICATYATGNQMTMKTEILKKTDTRAPVNHQSGNS